MKIYSRGITFDYLGGPYEGDVYCAADIEYTVDPNEDSDWYPSFIIKIGTPNGIKNYLNKVIDIGIYQDTFFLNNLIVVQEFNQEKVIQFIESSLQKFNGKSEKELIIRAMEHFDWNDETIPLEFEHRYDYLLSK